MRSSIPAVADLAPAAPIGPCASQQATARPHCHPRSISTTPPPFVPPSPPRRPAPPVPASCTCWIRSLVPTPLTDETTQPVQHLLNTSTAPVNSATPPAKLPNIDNWPSP
ncbi:hypothetical protein Hypma_009939 [Hypsizygus marmoreus]|uniref:Uncharacterized protein n=1 Tax=Hypsizygus marmoreus TaxID=39966 RepID=A0A369JMM5_HYPMA|nr:hypothetical protein Hypma_009939 [Hypsizygus marmoreus]